MKASKHDEDFFSWSQEQAALLRGMPETIDLLDTENLADEIEGLGLAEINGISSLLYRVLTGLLKTVVVPDSEGDRRRQYEDIIANQAEAVIKIPPGLLRHLDLPKIWKVAANGVSRSQKRAGIAVPALPEVCPLTLDELLDPEFDLDDAVKKLSAAISSG